MALDHYWVRPQNNCDGLGIEVAGVAVAHLRGRCGVEELVAGVGTEDLGEDEARDADRQGESHCYLGPVTREHG